jgi:hypothetical protein
MSDIAKDMEESKAAITIIVEFSHHFSIISSKSNPLIIIALPIRIVMTGTMYEIKPKTSRIPEAKSIAPGTPKKIREYLGSFNIFLKNF